MTKLQKKLKRRVDGKRLKLVLTVEPTADGDGGIVGVRELGRRAGPTITVEGLYRLLIWREVENKRAAKRTRRASRLS